MTYLIDHIAFFCLAVVFPIWDYLYLRKHRALIDSGRTGLRITVYHRTIGEEWLIAGALLGIWFSLGRNGAAIGVVPQAGPLVWVGYGLAALICAILVFQGWSTIRSPEGRAQMRERFGSLSFLLPQTLRERRLFDAMSVTAGVCEEVIFRGFLIAYFVAVLGVSFWVAAVLSSFVFGLWHAYQGPIGILRTALVGGFFALLYGITGSLWAPIIVHIVIDVVSGRAAFASFTENTPDGPSLGVAA